MSTYIIAECGQNHNGDIDIAMELINMASQPIFYNGERLERCNAVKFTVRDLEHEMTPQLANKRYNSKHRYATKYGNHREKLELSFNEIHELYFYANNLGLDFILTLCQSTLVDTYKNMCDKIKVASRDLNNIPLLKELAKTDKHIILSTGMISSSLDLVQALGILRKNKVSILHCVSSYPTNYKDLGLDTLQSRICHGKSGWLQKGFSDHTTGILAGPIAVALGAHMIEKHITLDRDMKGTDHAGSLGPEGFHRYIRDIRNTEKMLTKSYVGVCDQVVKNKKKLGRSLAYKANRAKGEMIVEQDLIMISPGGGLEWFDASRFIGKGVAQNVYKNNLVKENDFYE